MIGNIFIALWVLFFAKIFIIATVTVVLLAIVDIIDWIQ